MGTLIAVGYPVAKGQEDRARNFEKELDEQGLRGDYEELNRKGTVTRHLRYYEPTPMGDLVLDIMECEDPTKVGRAFTDSKYDQWWLDYLRDVHTLDIRNIPPEQMPSPPSVVYEWKA
ncbi:MAG TPA: hypothetical protein VF660_02480 [Actinomycetota bacterium]